MRLLALLLVAATAAIDLNAATDAQLTELGFTPAQAAQIVRYRSENGAFRQV